MSIFGIYIYHKNVSLLFWNFCISKLCASSKLKLLILVILYNIKTFKFPFISITMWELKQNNILHVIFLSLQLKNKTFTLDNFTISICRNTPWLFLLKNAKKGPNRNFFFITSLNFFKLFSFLLIVWTFSLVHII